MREFELEHRTESFYPSPDFAGVQGSVNLHRLFRKIRLNTVTEPFRHYDFRRAQWWVSANNWTGFWLTLEEAESLTYEELAHNLGRCINRKLRERRED
jgi:hypothetical protein